MKAAEAARKIRAAMKQAGIDPKGRVRVASNDYVTVLHIDLRYIYDDEAKWQIEEAIDEIPDNGLFDWEIE